MIDKLMERAALPLLVVGAFALMALAIFSVGSQFTEETEVCKVYSEERQAHGFIMSGKIMVPTTYTTRDCLVWEKEK